MAALCRDAATAAAFWRIVIATAFGLLLSSSHAFKGLLRPVNGIDAYPVEVEVNVGYGDTLIVSCAYPYSYVLHDYSLLMIIIELPWNCDGLAPLPIENKLNPTDVAACWFRKNRIFDDRLWKRRFDSDPSPPVFSQCSSKRACWLLHASKTQHKPFSRCKCLNFDNFRSS